MLPEWERERGRHPIVGEGRLESNVSRMWDENAPKYSSDRYRLIVSEITDCLVSKGYVSGTVLDIGCGPGTFSVPFSDTATTVYALDASRPMLDRMMTVCERECVSNVVPVYADCRHIPSEMRCDLAFSSLCPPMNSPESIIEMEKHGNVCAYVSSINSEISIEIEIWNALGKDYSYSGYNTFYPYRYLRSLGRDAEIHVFSQDNMTAESEESAVRRYVSLIAGYRPVTKEVEGTIRAIVSDHSENGITACASTMRMGLLIWSPPVSD